MEYSITCNGTPIGTAVVLSLAGLAHADLRPLPAFSVVFGHADAAARELREIRLWDTAASDFADQFARTWTGGRLALVDTSGEEVATASVMVVTGTRVRHGPRVIVDARPDMARVEALLRGRGVDGGGQSRPAA
jgi:hypothetical protein